MAQRGILRYGAYLPFRRLDRAEIAPVAGGGGGKGTRTVASYDEDTTTMAVEACRRCASSTSTRSLTSLWFATTTPAYADKTNATAVHAALGLDSSVPAFDVNGAVRSSMGALRAGLDGAWPALVVAADMRTGRPGSPDEAGGGDGAAALVVGEALDDEPLLAELIGWASVTDEFLDRWRTPGDVASKLWEERFGEGRYVAAGAQAWDDAVKAAGLDAGEVDHVIVVGANPRAGTSLARKLGITDKLAPSLDSSVGFTGAAHPTLALAAALDEAGAGQVVALVVLADGADVVLFRTTAALDAHRPHQSLTEQVATGGVVSYGRYLAWRGFLPVEPPRRPEPARPSASAAARSTEWKFGLVENGRPLADAEGTIATFTVDRMAYSPSPPVVFAIVDFDGDGGARLPVELTDVDPEEVGIGERVEMTFRKLFTADGIHNYFWKARPVRRWSGGEG